MLCFYFINWVVILWNNSVSVRRLGGVSCDYYREHVVVVKAVIFLIIPTYKAYIVVSVYVYVDVVYS